jgi:hypothetical protein
VTCDHRIGLYMPECSDMKASEFEQAKINRRKSFDKWKLNTHAHPSIIAKGEVASDTELLWQHHERFMYCPDCGSELSEFA